MERTSLPPDVENYIISSHELKELEKGAPIPLYFNTSIFFLSLAGSLLGSVLLPISDKGFSDSSTASIVLFIIACVLFSFGTILLLIWLKRNKDITKVVEEIKNRMPKNTASISSTQTSNLGNTQEN